ncbi:hypothetical protein BASA50_003636 [Batrachochytrium salamandrivorans]|uniref:NADH dehydrogenase [ubiquinone] iron-sulfur protein 5 n=1 Tax=Batrachochytrium salamandrivorans TaxID=1357716 RepID=A0ABQ8FI07_9FUNG|nr:hypothetical protein BASA62_007257 [Batrachochytrium salamandrivorans]KAH6569893.1 hypothetical protein BASA60_008090 [Batrachochytrium salamandrivorans]KAH6598597.1 hypothetical protein BASA50_003636 [Batrachochytrium salamandrivorans]KAH6600775.1 hypothetical protein BASA61_002193 [Batrachochytrium salamandrivorans]KAH9266676.1 hypothetical protein BASA84_001031 [Batrachochytrium salamandrivorans]
MSSGYGIAGGRGRCFTFWQEFTRCHVQADSISECRPLFEDYRECLYHKKEFLRMLMLHRHEATKGKSTSDSPTISGDPPSTT